MHPIFGLFDVLSKGHYYLDPGSGSFILQILLAVLLGGGYAVKVYWKKIKGLFNRSKNEAEGVEEPDQKDGEK
jgi:hypothetical protein